MILTCPRCATRYVVGEDQVGPQGRKVKCSACGEIWRAAEEPDFEIPADPYLIAPPEPEAEEAAPEPAPEPQPQPQEELRQRLRARARRRGEQGRTVLWATLTTLVVITVAVVVFRQEIALALETALR